MTPSEVLVLLKWVKVELIDLGIRASQAEHQVKQAIESLEKQVAEAGRT